MFLKMSPDPEPSKSVEYVPIQGKGGCVVRTKYSRWPGKGSRRASHHTDPSKRNRTQLKLEQRQVVEEVAERSQEYLRSRWEWERENFFLL